MRPYAFTTTDAALVSGRGRSVRLSGGALVRAAGLLLGCSGVIGFMLRAARCCAPAVGVFRWGPILDKRGGARLSRASGARRCLSRADRAPALSRPDPRLLSARDASCGPPAQNAGENRNAGASCRPASIAAPVLIMPAAGRYAALTGRSSKSTAGMHARNAMASFIFARSGGKERGYVLRGRSLS